MSELELDTVIAGLHNAIPAFIRQLMNFAVQETQ